MLLGLVLLVASIAQSFVLPPVRLATSVRQLSRMERGKRGSRGQDPLRFKSADDREALDDSKPRDPDDDVKVRIEVRPGVEPDAAYGTFGNCSARESYKVIGGCSHKDFLVL